MKSRKHWRPNLGHTVTLFLIYVIDMHRDPPTTDSCTYIYLQDGGDVAAL